MAGIDSASLIETLQSSLTAKNSTKAIMEFELSITAQAKFEYTNQTEILEIVFRMLKGSDEIKLHVPRVVCKINEVASIC